MLLFETSVCPSVDCFTLHLNKNLDIQFKAEGYPFLNVYLRLIVGDFVASPVG